MAGLKLDGAGHAKLNTLEEALIRLGRIHNVVEQYALAVKQEKPTGTLLMNLKRQFPGLASLLKGQFGMISDQILAIVLAIGRGTSEQMRVRQLREGVAQVRQAIDISIELTKKKHEQIDPKKSETPAGEE